VIKRFFILSAFLTFALLLSCSNSGKDGRENKASRDPVQKQYLKWLSMKQEAVPELKEAVKSERWRMRSHALIAMGKTGDKTLVPIIMNRLKEDGNQAVRNCAVSALGDLKAKESVPYLIERLKENRGKDASGVSRKVVIKTLGEIGDPRAVPVLYDIFLNSPNPISREAVTALIAIGDSRVSKMILRDKKKIASAGLENSAARILGKLPVPGAEDYLIGMLDDPSIQRRVAATVSLGQIKSRKATLEILPLIQADHRLLQKQASSALISINDPRAVDPLIQNFSDPDDSVAMASAYVLSRMNAGSIEKKVYARFSTSSRVNGPAAYVLGRKKYRQSLPLIRARLADASQPGQRHLAEALGWMDDRQSIPLLMKVARRDNIEGAIGSIWSLGQLKARQAVPMLLEMMKEDNRRLNAHIIPALGSIGDRRAVEDMVHFFYETGDRYARPIGYALGKIGGTDVVSFIKDNISSGDRTRILAGGSALIKMKNRSLIPYAETLLDSDERVVRKYAILFLKRVTGKQLNTEEEWKQWLSQDH
jgi:HEAT repeat protein